MHPARLSLDAGTRKLEAYATRIELKTMSSAVELFEVECVGNVGVVTPTTDLGEFTYEQLTREATSLLESLEDRTGKKDVVVDFCKTDYVGSSALGFLLKLWRTIRPREGHLALCNVSPHEHEILRITSLDTLWPIYPNRDAALNALGRPPGYPDDM